MLNNRLIPDLSPNYPDRSDIRSGIGFRECVYYVLQNLLRVGRSGYTKSVLHESVSVPKAIIQGLI